MQKQAIAEVHMSSDTLLQARQFFRQHQLGGAYHLASILQALAALDIGMETERTRYTLNDRFIDRLLQFGKNNVLREIKLEARIRIPNSYLLVGVADEGPTYEMEGEDVFKLEPNTIFGTLAHNRTAHCF